MSINKNKIGWLLGSLAFVMVMFATSTTVLGAYNDPGHTEWVKTQLANAYDYTCVGESCHELCVVFRSGRVVPKGTLCCLDSSGVCDTSTLNTP